MTGIRRCRPQMQRLILIIHTSIALQFESIARDHQATFKFDTLSIKDTLLKLLIVVKHGRDGISIEYPPLKRIDGLGWISRLPLFASYRRDVLLEPIAGL